MLVESRSLCAVVFLRVSEAIGCRSISLCNHRQHLAFVEKTIYISNTLPPVVAPRMEDADRKDGNFFGGKKYKLNKEVKRVIMKAGKLCGAPFTDKHTGPLQCYNKMAHQDTGTQTHTNRAVKTSCIKFDQNFRSFYFLFFLVGRWGRGRQREKGEVEEVGESGEAERTLDTQLMVNPQLYTVIYCRAFRPNSL